MISKILIFVVAVSFQAFAQSQFSEFTSPSKTAAEMWNPYTWITPYYTAAAKSWTNYLQNAQDASHQLYQQWDKTGAGDPFALGMQYAQFAVNQAQKGAEAAMNQAQKGAGAAMYQAQKGAGAAMNQAQKGAEAAMKQAGSLMPL